MITVTAYWLLKYQFDKDWNLAALVIPMTYDFMILLAGASWVYERL